ncbi:uncharacterized protein BCR38DRAFT_486228 [Pseudomassariella vexata]|uniref:Uncharacterized protein n=1 Tax=Pseudomassariella vexata TaxID=1141098 RepID=A0A1Y2DXY5_9PEZI|nr:uncharacterized protein BCR38DRAFT_486228 [Pseudomassariella vexata]ORY63495.1 hypothetical protein BCR38DRAFT_486228 [Pseudomassariella vexata]
MPTDSGSDNPFIRFKNIVDDTVAQKFRSLSSAGPVESTGDARNDTARDENTTAQTPALSRNPDIIGNRSTTGTTQQHDPPSQPRSYSSIDSITQELRHRTILSWATFSSYSPFNLTHLPQPKPRDACRNPAHGFTFRDAFEDLAAVSSGESLGDLETMGYKLAEKEPQNQTVASSSHCDVPPLPLCLNKWVNRLERRQLWGAYFPVRSFRDEAERILKRGGDREALIGQASMCKEERVLPRLGALSLIQLTVFPHLFLQVNPWWAAFDPFNLVNEPLAELYNPWIKALKTADWGVDASPREPETSEDLYLAHNSDFARRDPGSAFMASEAPDEFHLHRKAQARSDSRSVIPMWSTPSHSSFPNGNSTNSTASKTLSTETWISPEGKTVQRVERRVFDGMTQVMETTVQYNAKGSVVERTVINRQFSTKESDAASATKSYTGRGDQQTRHTSEQEVETNTAETTKKEKNGWFWI